MYSARPFDLPEYALLQKYKRAGHNTDCYRSRVAGVHNLAEYVTAFYTTPLFKSERFILRWAAGKPSSDEQALDLANGKSNAFAAWTTEHRDERQLLMCDFRGNTRSWFLVEHDVGDDCTFLYFGSAVIGQVRTDTEELRIGYGFRALLGLHRLYSLMLLNSARNRLIRQG